MTAEDQALSLEETADRGLRALAAQGPVRISVTGPCMEPCFHDGQIVEISPRTLYLPGDVVAFRPSGNEPRRLHRVLGYRLQRGRVCLVTRGDRARRTDPPIPLSQVLGRVSCRSHCVRMTERFMAIAGFIGLLVQRLARSLW